MGKYGKRAEQLFMEGYNCSQAVLLSYSDITGLDDKTAAMLASGRSLSNWAGPSTWGSGSAFRSSYWA